MIRNIIFDIGNVLVDFCWADFLKTKGFDEAMIDRIAKASILTETWNELDRGVWTEEELLDGFVKNDPEIEKELRLAFGNITGIVRLRDYACDWVKELKAKGYQVYYLSNYGLKTRRETAEDLIFMPLMDGGIMSYEVKLIKPSFEIYERLLETYRLKAEECVFLDDTLRNVEAARKVGMEAIQFTTKEAAVEQLLALGVNA